MQVYLYIELAFCIKTIYKSKVLESWGRGIALMVNECQRVGLQAPEFRTDGAFLWVVFRTSTKQAPYKYPTSTRQVEMLVELIGDNTYSVKEIMGLMLLKSRMNFLNTYLNPSIDANLVEPLYPEQPRHPKKVSFDGNWEKIIETIVILKIFFNNQAKKGQTKTRFA